MKMTLNVMIGRVSLHENSKCATTHGQAEREMPVSGAAHPGSGVDPPREVCSRVEQSGHSLGLSGKSGKRRNGIANFWCVWFMGVA